MAGPVPDIKLRTQVVLPAAIDDGTAITWTKESGRYRADLDLSDIVQLPSIPPEDANTTDLPVWNTVKKTFSLVPYVPSSFVIYGTSNTTNTIGTGSKSFSVQSGIGWLPGTRVRAADAANPTTKFMEGVITSYTGTTAVIMVDLVGGSGSSSSWNITIAAQTSSVSSENVTFNPGYTGAVDSTVKAGLSRRVYAADFGVVGAGSVSDTNKLQAFLDYLGGSPYKKGELAGIAGQQFATNASLIYQSNTTLEGSGANMMIRTAFNGSVLKSSGGSTSNRSGLILRDVVIDCTSMATYPSSVAVDLRNVSNSLLENVKFYNAGLGVQMYADSIALSCYYNHIFSCYAGTCGVGYSIGARANANSVIYSNANGCTFGATDEGDDNKIIGNAFEAWTTAGVRAQSTSAGLVIAWNRFEAASGVGIDMVAGAWAVKRIFNYFEGAATREADASTGSQAYHGALIGSASLSVGTVSANSTFVSSLISSGALGATAAGDTVSMSIAASSLPAGIIPFGASSSGGVRAGFANITGSSVGVGVVTVNFVVNRMSP